MATAGTPMPRPKRPRRKLILVLVVAVLAYPIGSYTRALTYPGAASFAVRTVDWLREIGLGGVVNTVENWWYTRHPPSAAPPPAGSLPTAPPPLPSLGAGPRPADLPAQLPRLPGEGRWTPGASTAGGPVADYTTFIRPDPAHASVVAGVAWINQSLVRASLIAGTKEPGGSGWPEGARVPSGVRPALLATFNAGFKFKDTAGGFYADGRTARPLKDGAASVVIDRSGRISIAQWGRDATMSPAVRAVRQNLALVVDNGSAVPGLRANAVGRWGSASNQFQYTWRSGLGTDRAGNLLYVAGDKLTLRTLAGAMVQAGIVRGMELDIHPGMVAFNAYRPDRPGSSPRKLLPAMPGSADRYLTADQRDFFAIVLRGGAPPASAGVSPLSSLGA
ncbi:MULTISPECIES: phosphodiester glycosidase family protein [Amycolatopsis]|uniref:Phosphodiester glycosidase family protein n=1 Tax=Amycolatopsis echigonensis TaxID=2576905 RepID=A0A2N3WL57_9PSEU|nr:MULTISPECIES: phosphodiester glycosidase family protein [Amycolatopsis]MBB2499954.1 phosphodiester glycosidase family protein [Amycolatopsis echigonensis]PKV94590.1 uncharacterized protein DUF2233 [Amycolatopsis niigatensis]